MEQMEPDFNALFLMALNGGAPLDDWDETKEWAESILRKEEEECRD